MSVSKCYRGDCTNPGVEKYAKEGVVSFGMPVCPEHQHRELERKPFEKLDPFECAELTDEEVAAYATTTDLSEEVIREQIAECKGIVKERAPSLVPKMNAREELFKAIYGAMITADTCLSDEDVVHIAGKTVERYRVQFGVQRVEKVGKMKAVAV